MDNFDTALAKWKKVGSDYEATFYAHEDDKDTLYAFIDRPAYIEKYLPSEKKTALKAAFIKKSDMPLLTKKFNFPKEITYRDVYHNEYREDWLVETMRSGKQKSLGWQALFDIVTAPKLKKPGGNNILLQRSTSPDYRFWIRLPSLHGDMNGENREKSVAFGQLPITTQAWAKIAVPKAIEAVKDKTGTWVSPNGIPQDSNKYILLSRNPFHLFETWIHEDDLKAHLHEYPDESFPSKDMVDEAVELLSGNQQAKGYFFPDAYKTETQKKISMHEEEAADDSIAHPDGELVWTRLSTDTMQQPYSKAKRPWDQNTTMGGTSAPDFASKLGWKRNAEWLHLSGYAWGGLASMFNPDSKATLASSQQPFNFCVGTPECNTHMLRWEKAWQNLFHKERSFSDAAIVGSLLICNNKEIKVAPPRRPSDAHYPRDHDPIWFDRYVLDKDEDWSLALAFAELGCLVFVMEYEVTFEGTSRILDSSKPKSDVQFHPFRRQLTTKTECLLDDHLFEQLLKIQNEIKALAT